LTGNQTALGMPLALGLVPDANRAAVAAKLAARVAADGYRMQVGEIGFRFVLKALSDNNRSDVIAQIASQTTSPSYGYLANSGRTTLSEAMDGNTADSQFHMMYGHIEEWFYYAALGIAPNTPGYAEIRFKPEVAGTLKSASGYVQTKNGKASSSWTCASKIFDQDITIPTGGSGLVYLPCAGFGVDSAMAYANTTVIWKNRAVAGNAGGVVCDSIVNNYLVVSVSSGNYHFRIGPPNTPAPTVAAAAPIHPDKRLSFTLRCKSDKMVVQSGKIRTIRIFDLRGRELRRLSVPSGAVSALWDCRDESGATALPGIYLFQLIGNTSTATVKMKVM
jgi:hypothetical protein